MSDKFARVPVATTNRSRHDLSSPHITTTDFGRIDVVYHTQLVPGDNFHANLRSFLRAAPMPQPTMGKVYLNVRAFFVPNRILCNKSSFDWDLWRNGESNNSHPYCTEENIIARFLGTNPLRPSHIRDYRRLLGQLGLPSRIFNRTSAFSTQSEYNQKYSPFPFFSYNRIWWDWYRDSNLIPDSQRSAYIDQLSAGFNGLSKFEPRYCCYPKDYFTTAKVNAQNDSTYGAASRADLTGANFPSGPNPYDVVLSNGATASNAISSSNYALSIQFLRVANSLQHYLERNNIAGGRIMARYYARFGATPDSVRLDQSEYIGGFSTPLNISDVTSLSNEGGFGITPDNGFIVPDDSYAGQQAGKGYINGGSQINYHCKEDGTLMILQSLVPEVFYYEGIPADFLRGVDNVKEDYFTPEFENIGYEPIRKKEVAANRADLDGTAGTTDNEIFGFQPRYSKYKFKLGTISGDMTLSETMTGMQGFNLFRKLVASNGASGADLLPGFTMILPEDRHSFDRIFSIPGSAAGEFDHFWGIHFVDAKIDRPMSAAKLPSLEEDSHSSGKQVTIDNGGVRM